MTNIIDYGPLGNQSLINKDREDLRIAKEQHQARPFKYRAQEATMHCSRKVAEHCGSYFKSCCCGGKDGDLDVFELTLWTLLTPVVFFGVIGTVAFGIMRVSEGLFGKSIKLDKEGITLEEVAKYSSRRIDKNLKRGVIDEETSKILKGIRGLNKLIKNHDKALSQLNQKHSALLKRETSLQAKLHRIDEQITTKKNNLQLLSDLQGKDSNKGKQKLTELETKKNDIETQLGTVRNGIQQSTNQMEEIKSKYNIDTEPLRKSFDAKSSVSRELRIERDRQRILLKTIKTVDKKSVDKDSKIDAKTYFDSKYVAYVKQYDLSGACPAMTHQEYINHYYQQKKLPVKTT